MKLGKYFAIFILIAVLSITATAIQNDSVDLGGGVTWKHLDIEDVFSSSDGMIVAGFEQFRQWNTKQYVCRALTENRWVPGRMFFLPYSNKIACFYEDDGDEHSLTLSGENQNRIQVLVYPEGRATWIPLSSDSAIPANIVIGGTHPNGETATVCRVKHSNGNIFPGSFSSLEKECRYGFYGGKVAKENIEILVLNEIVDDNVAVRGRTLLQTQWGAVTTKCRLSPSSLSSTASSSSNTNTCFALILICFIFN